MVVEVYESNMVTTCVVSDDANKQSLLETDAVLVRTIEGKDWDDCMTQHHQHMNWEPYKPFEE